MTTNTRFLQIVAMLFVTWISATGTAAPAAPLSAEHLLTRDLSAAVKSMPRETVMYHYFNITQWYQEFGTVEGRQSYADRYYEAVTARFWDNNLNQSQYINSGPGLYAAIDPHISKGYGNTALELTVPAGAKYINVVRAISLKSDTIRQLLKENILKQNELSGLFSKNGSQYGFTRDTFKNMIQVEHAEFRKIVQEILLKNSISLIEYNWNTSLGSICRQHSHSAFVFIGIRKSTSEAPNTFQDTTKKILVYGAPISNLSEAETVSTNRTKNFREMLTKLADPAERNKRNEIISGAFPENKLNELLGQTYSCVR